MKTYTMPPRPVDTDPLANKVNWLVQTHGFDARAGRVVMLYEPSASCVMALQSFQEEYAAWSEMQPRMGKNGPLAPRLVLATELWSRSSSRISVAGIRMRPDRDFPIYIEAGQVFKNTYRKPVHEGQGDVAPFLRFLDRFLPDEVDSCFMLDWMAHKMRYPEIPGSSPWFLADSDDGPLEGRYGTGRGFMARIAHKLYGEAYCKAEDFDILTGQSGQAAYTDWQAYCVLATVDEAQVSPTAHRHGEKRSVYTALKNCLDPAPKRRTFKVKGQQAFDGISYCSVWVATNHANAAAIPANDRRVTVLRNGREMTLSERNEIAAWIEAPGSIAALAEYLGRIDLEGFDMYTPMKTAAKDEMADLGLNDVEHALLDLAAEDRGLVFPKMWLEREVLATLSGSEDQIGGSNVSAWRGQFAGAVTAHCAVVRTANGDKAKIRVGGRRVNLFAFRSKMKAALALDETERRQHAGRWGHIDNMQTVLREVGVAPQGGPPDEE